MNSKSPTAKHNTIDQNKVIAHEMHHILSRVLRLNRVSSAICPVQRAEPRYLGASLANKRRPGDVEVLGVGDQVVHLGGDAAEHTARSPIVHL